MNVAVVCFNHLTILHSERPKLYRVLAVLNEIGLIAQDSYCQFEVTSNFTFRQERARNTLEQK